MQRKVKVSQVGLSPRRKTGQTSLCWNWVNVVGPPIGNGNDILHDPTVALDAYGPCSHNVVHMVFTWALA